MVQLEIALIDRYFTHGLVGQLWCQEANSEIVVIINDQLAQDNLRQGLIEMNLGGDRILRCYSLEEAHDQLARLKSNQKGLVIFKDLDDLFLLARTGVAIKRLVIANYEGSGQVQVINEDVSLNQEDLRRIAWLENLGTRVDYQNLPKDEK
ncbi:PTS sugar transporter subunit IIB [Hutsoniella sourekii]